MSEAKDIIAKMCELQNSSEEMQKELSGWEGVVQYKLGDEEFYVEYRNDGTCSFNEGKHDSPKFTVIADPEFWLGVLKGKEDPISSYLMGKYKIEGNLFEAQKLAKVLKKFAGKI